MLLARKATCLALLSIIFLSLLAAFVGEHFDEGYNMVDHTPGKDVEPLFMDSRGTRANDPPQVTSTLPMPFSVVPINTEIKVNFTEGMNTNSVENAFSYTNGSHTWDKDDGVIVWTNGDTNLTFTPTIALNYGELYQVTIEYTAMDKEGELLDGNGDGTGGEPGVDDHSWSFNTIFEPPQVIETFPENGAQDVLVDTNIIINFSKTMETHPTETAFNYTDGTTTWYIASGDVNWNNDFTGFTFTPGSDLQNGVHFWVTLSSLAMDVQGTHLDSDGDGNPGEIGEDDYIWEFTTILAPPKIESTIPQHGSSFIPVDASVTINFNHKMDKSATQTALSYTEGTIIYSYTNGMVTWSNEDRTMTFTPFLEFENEKTYTFTIEHTAMDIDGTHLDADNDGIGGEEFDDDFSWSFTIVPTPPQIISTYPEGGAKDIFLDTNIVITFSKSMNRNSVQNAFNYTDGINEWGVSDGMVSWGNSDKTFTFTPSSELDNNIQYQVSLVHTATSSDGVLLDADGDDNPGEPGEDDYIWSFTTIPLPPQIISTSPEHGSTFVLTNTSVQITFTKSMDKGSVSTAFTYNDGIVDFSSINGVITWSDNDRTMTFEPTIRFQNEVLYTFTIDHSAEDAEGVFLDADNDGIGGEEGEDDYSWSFTTMPEPPKVSITTPKNLATKVPIHSWINITFTKPMDQISVEEAFSFSYEGTNLTYDSSDGFVTWSEDSKAMSFEPSSVFEYDKDYFVRIEATAKDDQGITLDGNRNKLPEGVDIDFYRWSFTTIQEPPKILSVVPSENSQDVAVDADIVMNFDKSMNKAATQKAFSYTYVGSSETFKIASGTSEWTDGDKTLTFNPDIDFEEGKRYTITIEKSAKDIDGVAFEGYEWSFTVKVNSPPDLEGGGVHPESGDTSEKFKFSIVYTDIDNDKPKSIKVIIDDFEWRMYESDTKVDDFTEGKVYEYEIELDEGEHSYYFEASDGKNDVRFPQGTSTKKMKVTAKGEELILGIFEEEYEGLPTIICLPLGIVILVAAIIVIIMLIRGGRAGEETIAFEALGEGEAAPTTFMPMPGEDIMSFTTFEEIPSLEEAKPVLIQCPECEQHLRVRATQRPFMFPCKCGAKLILK